MPFTEEKIEEIKEFLVEQPGRVYLGCDSVKFKKGKTWFARYAVVLVVHMNNAHGCKIFGYCETERDYDQSERKPRMRLMNEVYKVAELYMLFAEELEDREVEVHLDINPNEKHNSSIVLNEATGYILGMTGIKAKVKPEAFAASYAADASARKHWFSN